MQKEAGITLNIENTNPASYCEMKVDGVVEEKITVLPGGAPKLSFLDCPSEELLLTVTKTLGRLPIILLMIDSTFRPKAFLKPSSS